MNILGGFGGPSGKAPNQIVLRKKISTTVYITEEQNERLKQLNDKTKVPIAEFIRQGIDLVLDKYGHQLPGQLSLLETPKQRAAK